MELFFDDMDFISKKLKKLEVTDDIKSEPIKFDEMLENETAELNGLIEGNDIIKKLTDPVNVEKDKYLNNEEES